MITSKLVKSSSLKLVLAFGISRSITSLKILTYVFAFLIMRSTYPWSRFALEKVNFGQINQFDDYNLAQIKTWVANSPEEFFDVVDFNLNKSALSVGHLLLY